MFNIRSLKEADITIVEYGKSCCFNVCIYRSSLLGFGKSELGVGLVASTLSRGSAKKQVCWKHGKPPPSPGCGLVSRTWKLTWGLDENREALVMFWLVLHGYSFFFGVRQLKCHFILYIINCSDFFYINWLSLILLFLCMLLSFYYFLLSSLNKVIDMSSQNFREFTCIQLN